MGTGAGFGGLLFALLPLITVVTILQARRKRKRDERAPEDEAFEERQAAARETERRMESYLASRDSRSWRDDGG